MRDYPGYNGAGAPKRVLVTTAAPVQLVEPNPRRIALLFGPTATDALVLGFDSNLTTTNGINLLRAGGLLLLSRALHGGMVTRAWWGIHSLADNTITLWESFE